MAPDEASVTLRPYAYEFLEAMSRLFDVYIFTSASKEYALPLVNILNRRGQPIKGLLHRQHCLKTRCGFYIKDLRIVENHPTDQIVLVDNSVFSFAFQLANGIPIQSYFGRPDDKALRYLERFLERLSEAASVPEFLEEQLKLESILTHPMSAYMTRLDETKITFGGPRKI